MEVDKISKLSGISRPTINKILPKIREKFPKFDLSKFKPDEKIIKQVSDAIAEIKKQKNEEDLDSKGKVKISRIFKELNYDISYEMINLVLVFV